MSDSRDWWVGIRTTAFFTPEQVKEAEPEPVDPAAIGLSEWGQHREQLGLGGFDSDFIGIDGNQAADWPDWRHLPEQPEPEQTEMAQYVATERAAAGIKGRTSSVLGCPAPQPRSHTSPWSDGHQR
jgi:hypothetical protein